MSRYFLELALAAAHVLPPSGCRPSRKTVADTTGYTKVCIFGGVNYPMPEAGAPRAQTVDYLQFPHRVTIQHNTAGDVATCGQHDL